MKRTARSARAPPVEGVVDALPEERAVRESCQRVVEGLECELLLQGLALPQVSGVQDHAGGVVVAGAAAGDRLDRQPGVVVLTDPPLAACSAARLTQSVGDDLLEDVGVLRMAQVGQRCAEQGWPGRAQQSLRRRADVVDRARPVDGHDEVRGVAHQPPESGLGLASGPVGGDGASGRHQLTCHNQHAQCRDPGDQDEIPGTHIERQDHQRDRPGREAGKEQGARAILPDRTLRPGTAAHLHTSAHDQGHLEDDQGRLVPLRPRRRRSYRIPGARTTAAVPIIAAVPPTTIAVAAPVDNPGRGPERNAGDGCDGGDEESGAGDSLQLLGRFGGRQPIEGNEPEDRGGHQQDCGDVQDEVGARARRAAGGAEENHGGNQQDGRAAHDGRHGSPEERLRSGIGCESHHIDGDHGEAGDRDQSPGQVVSRGEPAVSGQDQTQDADEDGAGREPETGRRAGVDGRPLGRCRQQEASRAPDQRREHNRISQRGRTDGQPSHGRQRRSR